MGGADGLILGCPSRQAPQDQVSIATACLCCWAGASDCREHLQFTSWLAPSGNELADLATGTGATESILVGLVFFEAMRRRAKKSRRWTLGELGLCSRELRKLTCTPCRQSYARVQELDVVSTRVTTLEAQLLA